VTSPAGPAAPTPASQPSVGEAFSDVAADLGTLMRQEVQLAKSELRQSATRAGKGAGMLVGAGVAGHMVLLFVSVAAWWQHRPRLVSAARRDRLADHRHRPGAGGPAGNHRGIRHAADRADSQADS
jgi:Putative Actinobacterial Holin-X, holin superfamily III